MRTAYHGHAQAHPDGDDNTRARDPAALTTQGARARMAAARHEL